MPKAFTTKKKANDFRLPGPDDFGNIRGSSRTGVMTFISPWIDRGIFDGNLAQHLQRSIPNWSTTLFSSLISLTLIVDLTRDAMMEDSRARKSMSTQDALRDLGKAKIEHADAHVL